MKKIITSTLVLVAITLVAGLALAAVYEVTKEPIAEAELTAKLNAYRMVMPDADNFIATGNIENEAHPIRLDGGVFISECLTATDAAGNTVGYAVNVTSPNGYGGNITIAVGLLPDATIKGISVISQGETAGLGAVCAEEKFTEQFAGIQGPVEYVKTGKTEPNQIDAISGATITTKAVTEAVNAAITWLGGSCYFEQGGND